MGHDEILAVWAPANRAAALQAPLRCYSLARVDGACDVNCAVRVAEWGDRFGAYAARRPNEGFDLLTRSVPVDGRNVDVGVFEHPLAMLQVPNSVDEYDQQIGDKSRNMARKALRAGYYFKPEAKGSEHLQDIFDIRNSSPTRMDVAIPEYWKRPASQPTNNKGLCGWHGELFFGVFLGNAMVAYTTLYLFGEIAQFNQILGHAEHLSNGVMNLLVRSVIEQLRLTHPQVRAINYLYPDAKYTLGRFKRGIGALPCRTLTTLALPETARAIERLFPVEVAPVAASRHRAKVESIDITLDEEPPEATPSDHGEEALGQLFGRFSLQPGDRVALSGFAGPELAELEQTIRAAGGAPGVLMHDDVPSERNAAVLVAPSAGWLAQALGKHLSSYASALADRGWLAVRFPHRPSVALACGALAADEAEAVSRFLERRFRSPTPSDEDYLRGFKGGDFQLRGVLSSGDSAARGLAWLLLRKVSNR